MHLIMMGEPAWQLFDGGLKVRLGVHADIVAFERAAERFGHAVRLRAADRAGARDPPDVARKGAGVARFTGCRCKSLDRDRAGGSPGRSDARRWRPSAP